MADVLLSIRQEWCNLIIAGKKTVEIRKTRPKQKTPFKCYILRTGCEKTPLGTACMYDYEDGRSYNLFELCGSRKVIGEFVCDKIDQVNNCGDAFFIRNSRAETDPVAKASCLSFSDMREYLGEKDGYAWHISELKLYDEPKRLSAFHKPCEHSLFCESCGMFNQHPEPGFCGNAALQIKRSPQSWCYVEEGGGASG